MPAKPDAVSDLLGPYFGSTPPEAYFRPDHRAIEPTRAAAVRDGRHVDGEACSLLPGRSLTAASTPAQCFSSGPEGATRTAACHFIAARLDSTGWWCGARRPSEVPIRSGIVGLRRNGGRTLFPQRVHDLHVVAR
jgi:hypothetical protein